MSELETTSQQDQDDAHADLVAYTLLSVEVVFSIIVAIIGYLCSRAIGGVRCQEPWKIQL